MGIVIVERITEWHVIVQQLMAHVNQDRIHACSSRHNTQVYINVRRANININIKTITVTPFFLEEYR